MKGAIFSKIDTGSESIDQASLVSATKRFLNDTSRIKFIVYCWDMSPAQNSIAFGYGAVSMDGDMVPIFGSAARPIVARFMLDADVKNRNT